MISLGTGIEHPELTRSISEAEHFTVTRSISEAEHFTVTRSVSEAERFTRHGQAIDQCWK